MNETIINTHGEVLATREYWQRLDDLERLAERDRRRAERQAEREERTADIKTKLFGAAVALFGIATIPIIMDATPAAVCVLFGGWIATQNEWTI